MNQTMKRKWVKALVDGYYKQTTGGLREVNVFNGGRTRFVYCCLGVARYAIPEMRRCKGWQDGNGWLTTEELRVLGFDQTVERKLARLNDEGVPFDMIAGLIDCAL
jgi:hypothetical protein